MRQPAQVPNSVILQKFASKWSLSAYLYISSLMVRSITFYIYITSKSCYCQHLLGSETSNGVRWSSPKTFHLAGDCSMCVFTISVLSANKIFFGLLSLIFPGTIACVFFCLNCFIVCVDKFIRYHLLLMVNLFRGSGNIFSWVGSFCVGNGEWCGSLSKYGFGPIC